MKDLFQLLKKHNLTPNGYYILYCLDANLDHRELPVTAIAELTKLKHYGYIDKATGHLTQDAKLVLIEASKLFLRTAKSLQDEMGDDFTENVKIFRDIFPGGIQKGRALRTSVTDLTPRFVWFFKTYPGLTWDTIHKASEKYIESFGKDLTYCKNSSYFIKKDDKFKSTISDLATWCENISVEDTGPSGDYGGFNDII